MASSHPYIYITFVLFYFLLKVIQDPKIFDHQLLEMMIKCSAIITLAQTMRVNIKELQELCLPHREQSQFFIGILFSVLGDAFLVWDNYHFVLFLFGLVSFLVSHVYYVRSFGLQPRMYKLGLLVFAVALSVLVACVFLERNSKKPMQFELFLVTVSACTLYSGVLYAGVWRALVRLTIAQDEWDKERSKERLCGILLYVLSDTLIAANKFIINSENTWCLHMSTYFLAQYLLTESSLDLLKKQNVTNARIPITIEESNGSSLARTLSTDLTSFIRAWRAAHAIGPELLSEHSD